MTPKISKLSKPPKAPTPPNKGKKRMAGSKVDRNLLDAKMSEAVVSVRRAFRQVETIQNFLANNPVPDGGAGVDPLEGEFGYTHDEAYLIRLVFGDLNYAADNLRTTMSNGRKLTGLE